MYLDSAYIAKFYVNEPDAEPVRKLIRQSSYLCSSAWALVEVTSVFHRHMREGSLDGSQARQLADLFRKHAEDGIWDLLAITDAIVRRTAAMISSFSATVPVRAGDAIHLATARHVGETEIWTSDRRLLAAAESAGLTGRSV